MSLLLRLGSTPLHYRNHPWREIVLQRFLLPVARLAIKRKALQGIVVSPDNRYAFVSVEGIGSEPGTVEVLDLAALKTVAVVDVAQQAAGIVFWKLSRPANLPQQADDESKAP